MIREKNQNMKSAYIEQIIMWMVIFMGFVWMFFFALQYATSIRISESMDSMSRYGARYVSNSSNQINIPGETALFNNLNNIKINKITDVDVLGGDINCVIAAAAPENVNSQSIFITQGTYTKNSFLKGQGANNFSSKVVVYNERSQAQIVCTLTVIID